MQANQTHGIPARSQTPHLIILRPSRNGNVFPLVEGHMCFLVRGRKGDAVICWGKVVGFCSIWTPRSRWDSTQNRCFSSSEIWIRQDICSCTLLGFWVSASFIIKIIFQAIQYNLKKNCWGSVWLTAVLWLTGSLRQQCAHYLSVKWELRWRGGGLRTGPVWWLLT